MATCSNCGGTNFKDGICIQCGVGPQIGPEAERAVDRDYVCPQCGVEFDGWDCNEPGCGYKLPEKRRRVIGQRLSEEEASKLRKRLGIE